jgi:hypothetical protein
MRDAEPRPRGIPFIPGATPEQAGEIQQAMLRPEGTLLLRLRGAELYSQPGSFTVLEVPSGATLNWVTRDSEHRLRYVHVSPGTGTREAVLELPDLVESSQLLLVLTWSASGTSIHAGFVGHDVRQAQGGAASAQIRVVRDGVYVVGDAGVEVAAYQVFENGKLTLRESAMEAWISTGIALDIHMRGSVVDGYLGEVVQANLALVMLATGFEVYCGRRFSELPEEGREADVDALARTFVPKSLRAIRPLVSLEDVLAAAPIDFGNYAKCRDAYRAAYGLGFAATVGVPTQTLGTVSRMLRYRHRIVHVSPLIGMLNQPRVPPEKPVFAGRDLVEEVRLEADRFVHALHDATLRLG